MSPSPDFGLSFGVYNSDLSAAMVQNGTAVYQGTLTGEAFNFEFEQPGCTCSYAISENWHNNNLPDERASSSPTLSIWGIKGNRQDKSIAPGAVVLYGTLPLVSVSLSAPAVNGLSVTVNSVEDPGFSGGSFLLGSNR